MKRAAWVDQSFRRKSRATDDLLAVVRNAFEVDEFWDESWLGRAGIDPTEIRRGQFDALVLFQAIHSHDWIASCGCPNTILIPMFDAHGGLDRRFFWRYARWRFISFSGQLHAHLRRAGLLCRFFRYYPPVPDARPSASAGDQITGFFWPRTEALDWRVVRILASGTPFSRFHIHDAPDPGERPALPSDSERRTLHVTYSRWEPDATAYRERLGAADVVFAPRQNEGIGLGFLEAMALGKCVIAPNAPTMNEYIRDGENGLLYDPALPRPLDLSAERIRALGSAARASCLTGRSRWLASIPAFVDELGCERRAGIGRRVVSRLLAAWDRRRRGDKTR